MSSSSTPYADLVFHVLAHVRPSAPLNASLFHPRYVEFCRGYLGDPGERALGEDARALARVLSQHDDLARVQTLAWLFDSTEEAAQWNEVELADFPGRGPFRSEVLDQMRRGDPVSIELLRCAIALEAEHYERLPRADRGGEVRVHEELRELHDVAPRLREVEVRCCRTLGLRGRAWGRVIFVGLPESLPHAPSVEHAALQAAHEVTVQEVSRAERMTFLDTEHSALALLRIRMREHPKAAAHGRWLASLNLSQFGGVGGLALERLSEASQNVVTSLQEQTR